MLELGRRGENLWFFSRGGIIYMIFEKSFSFVCFNGAGFKYGNSDADEKCFVAGNMSMMTTTQR